jgi:hypothetical protein
MKKIVKFREDDRSHVFKNPEIKDSNNKKFDWRKELDEADAEIEELED